MNQSMISFVVGIVVVQCVGHALRFRGSHACLILPPG
jgi:hypothetical protein